MVITQEVVRDCFDYHPVTGQLFWKERPKKYFKYERDWKRFNTIHAGREVKPGYHDMKFLRTSQQKNRMIWLYHTGFLLDGKYWKVQTVNRNVWDKRIENLVYTPMHIAGRQKLNDGPSNNNSTGLYGIIYDSREGRDYFCAYGVDSKGTRISKKFDKFIDAYWWRMQFESEYVYKDLSMFKTGDELSIPYETIEIPDIELWKAPQVSDVTRARMAEAQMGNQNRRTK